MSLKQQIERSFSKLNVLERLIAIMVVLFILPLLINTLLFLFNSSAAGWLRFLELSAAISELIYKPWTLISYGFFHGSFGHIFWNMLLLYISGGLMLNLFKTKLLLNTFFVGIIAGGLVYIGSYNLFPAFHGTKSALIGSSAGVMAVLVFMASYMPNSPIRVFVFSIPIKYIALFFIFLDVIQIPVSNAGGHLAHLGGAAWGYIYQREFLKGNDIGAWFMRFVEQLNSFFSSSKKPKRQKRKKLTKTTTTGIDQQKIDQILDKIAASGYESLTKQEKEYLFRAGKE
jgi:membrane associated rhomboid family serine protease